MQQQQERARRPNPAAVHMMAQRERTQLEAQREAAPEVCAEYGCGCELVFDTCPQHG